MTKQRCIPFYSNTVMKPPTFIFVNTSHIHISLKSKISHYLDEFFSPTYLRSTRLKSNNQRKRRLFFWAYITLCKVISSPLLSPIDNREPVLCPRLLLVMSHFNFVCFYNPGPPCQAAEAPVWSPLSGHHFSLLGMQTLTGILTFIVFPLVSTDHTAL